MRPFLKLVAGCLGVFLWLAPAPAETRLGLVIGNAAYPDASIKTAANDGALIAETLRSVGFDVSEGRDLDQTTMRRVTRDFIDKVNAADDDVVVFVYVNGHAIQLGGVNYLVPVDARLDRPSDVAAETVSLSNLLTDLAGSKAKTRFVVIDSGPPHPFLAKAKLARGPALTEATASALVAFSTSPGEAAIESGEDYGFYAQALLEMLREPGLTPSDIFDRVKLRTHERAKGAMTPVHFSALATDFRFLEKAEPAPAAPQTAPTMSQLDAAAAYALALKRDNAKGFQEFVATYANEPTTKSMRARAAQAREAAAWRRASQQKTREAFWTYRRWYPRGPHFEDAGYQLIALGAPLGPPPGFIDVVWEEIEPPPPEELALFEEFGPAPLGLIEIAAPPPMSLVAASSSYAAPPPPTAPSHIGMLPAVRLAAIAGGAMLPRVVRPPPPRAVFSGVRPPPAGAPSQARPASRLAPRPQADAPARGASPRHGPAADPIVRPPPQARRIVRPPRHIDRPVIIRRDPIEARRPARRGMDARAPVEIEIIRPPQRVQPPLRRPPLRYGGDIERGREIQRGRPDARRPGDRIRMFDGRRFCRPGVNAPGCVR